MRGEMIGRGHGRVLPCCGTETLHHSLWEVEMFY